MSVAGARRHSKAEIAAKVAQAGDLAAQGMLQREIVHTLGISTMTLHRWRKATPTPAEAGRTAQPREPGMDRVAAELEIENSRLRRLVVDLLLEKIELEEAKARGLPAPRQSRSPAKPTAARLAG
jgi:transposase